eukprot:Clim_evm40s153 gene=Clim_evmTU40s153
MLLLVRKGVARGALQNRLQPVHCVRRAIHESTASTPSKNVQDILEGVSSGESLIADQIITLLKARRPADVSAIVLAANAKREQLVGDRVTYVVNRNINFTNVCVKRCGFCAFSRTMTDVGKNGDQEGYFLPMEEVVRRAKQAAALGATEVCIQAGMPPHMRGDYYIRLCAAVKEAVPDLHIHGFSPEEIEYGAKRMRCSTVQYLAELKLAGVGSLPGTSAEILVDDVRKKLAAGRLSSERWVNIVETAHNLDIPTTSTIMYGHIEEPQHVAEHLLHLRNLQGRTGGITEFVPLSFVFSEAPMFRKGKLGNIVCRPGPTGIEVLLMHAVGRLALDNIKNVQVSWVKEGARMAQILLNAGANDLGGSLINESISTSAGAKNGQLMRPRELRNLVTGAGRIPVERSTLYDHLKVYENSAVADEESLLDTITPEQAAEVFGSYNELIKDSKFTFKGMDVHDPTESATPAGAI